jgi:VanZ family protein
MSLRVPLLPRWARWSGVALVVAVIVYNSLFTTPPDTIPVAEFSLEDEWLHFVAYGGLGGVLSYALYSPEGSDSRQRRAGFVFGVVVAFGLFIELAQGLTPGRYMALDDAIANMLGVLLSTIWYALEPRVQFVRLREVLA